MADEIRYVVVTGGAPYKSGMDFNTSALIRDHLPGYIHRANDIPIKILKYPRSMESTYSDMSDMIEKVWKEDLSVFDPTKASEKIDIRLILHMGMAPSSSSYAMESTARKHVFDQPGVDGVRLPSKFTDTNGLWDGIPDTLVSEHDLEKIRQKVKEQLPEVPLVISNDAGNYFCAFQFYSSLVEVYKRQVCRRQGSPRVAFLHIPPWKEPESIKIGANLVELLILFFLDDQEEMESES